MASRGPTRPTRSAITTAQALVVASQAGVTLAVAVGVGLFAGQWLDGRLGSGLVFTLIGAFVGLAAALTSMVRIYRAALRRNEAAWGGEPAAAPPARLADEHPTHTDRTGPA